MCACFFLQELLQPPNGLKMSQILRLGWNVFWDEFQGVGGAVPICIMTSCRRRSKKTIVYSLQKGRLCGILMRNMEIMECLLFLGL